MAGGGYIKLYRSVRGTAIADNPEYFAAWVHLLLMATHTEHDQVCGRQVVKLKPGQLVFGRDRFSATTGLSVNKVRAALKVMETLKMITIKSTTKYSVISITKWAEYQSQSPTDHQQIANKSPTDDHKQEGIKNGSKMDQEKQLSTELATPDAAFYIPTNKHGTQGETYPVTDADLTNWTQIYPAVNLESEMRKIIGWSQSNPAKRKTLKGMPKFINSWLSRAQDKGGGMSTASNPQSNDILGGSTW